VVGQRQLVVTLSKQAVMSLQVLLLQGQAGLELFYGLRVVLFGDRCRVFTNHTRLYPNKQDLNPSSVTLYFTALHSLKTEPPLNRAAELSGRLLSDYQVTPLAAQHYHTPPPTPQKVFVWSAVPLVLSKAFHPFTAPQQTEQPSQNPAHKSCSLTHHHQPSAA